MPATLATAAAIVKEIYEGNLVEQLNNDTVALNRIEHTSDGVSHDVGGRYVTFPIHTTRNSGIGARNELEALPTAGQQGITAARVGLRYQYGALQLSGQAIELVNSNAQAFLSILDLEMKGLKNDLQKDLNRQFFDNQTGQVSICTTANGTAANTFTTTFTQWAQVGMNVDYIQAANISTGTVTYASRQITAIQNAVGATPGVITLSGAAFTTAVGDILVRSGNVNREWTGLQSILNNSGVLYNVDSSVYPMWKAEVDSNGGTLRAISEGLMINMADRIRTNGGSVTVIYQSLGVRRAYFNLLSQIRQVVNTQDFSGGFKGLAFTTDTGEIPVIADVDCPINKQLFLNEDQIKLYQDQDWSFMDKDGSIWQRVITSAGAFDAYQAMMFQYSEIGTFRRNTHGIIQDITEG